MIEMTIQTMAISPENYRGLVILKEETGECYLPIWVGSAEAGAIAAKLQGADMPRPLSHDLLCSVIGNLKASVDSVVINELRDDTFYARILLNTSEGQTDVDSRPSDALAVAVRAGVPILVEETVLDEGGVLIDSETGQVVPHQTSEEKSVTEDELERLSAFSDFINTLDTNKLGEEKKGDEDSDQ
ncbi:MAG: bifunctional nuclease family protein [Dehalococcoidia bacterium]